MSKMIYKKCNLTFGVEEVMRVPKLWYNNPRTAYTGLYGATP